MKSDSYTTSTSIGPQHEDNQDSYLADDRLGLFAVADGVGGYHGGKHASSETIKTLEEMGPLVFDTKGANDVMGAAQAWMLREQRKLGADMMGTTLAFVRILPGAGKGEYRLIVGSIGDSPVLLIKEGAVKEINPIDSYRDTDPTNLYTITQYIGDPDGIAPHALEMGASAGDVIAICSDGVTDNLGYRGDYKPLADAFSRDPSAKGLVAAAIRTGIKRDDMTAVVVSL